MPRTAPTVTGLRSTDCSPVIRHELARVEEDLVRRYRGKLPAETVRRYLAEALEDMGEVRVTQFVPALALRAVRRRVEASGDPLEFLGA